MPDSDFMPDSDRRNRVGLDEAVLCEFKTREQIERIVEKAESKGSSLLLTRLNQDDYSELKEPVRSLIDYEEISRTGIVGSCPKPSKSSQIAIVTAGTSDVGVAREAVRTLLFHGFGSEEFYDVGVAGLWRVMKIESSLRQKSVVIVVAGMDAALPSVIAGLIPAAIIAVPTSVGYGVAEGGYSALESILSSCAPGLATVNIDNGYGAACAVIRILNSVR